MDVKFGDHDTNLTKITEEISRLAGSGVDIVVFPECCLAGYCIDSLDQRSLISVELDSTEILVLQSTVDATGVCAILGIAECTGGLYYNTAILLQPNVRPNYYRKSHLPELGYDKFVTPGNDLPIYETPFGKIGILICFDVRFPEAFRVLALRGADAVFLPTNWPKGAEISAEILCVARAAENKICVITCNRTGIERGFSFIGRSKIIDAFGNIVSEAGSSDETIIADVDFSVSRNKRNITIPGKHETTIFESRRPELYGPIFNQTEQIGDKTQ